MMTKKTDELPIEKARRNLAFVESRRTGNVQSQAQLEMAAFLDFMHPDMPDEQKFALIRAAS
jgi:hypothetical protein